MTRILSITEEYYQKAMEFADLSRIYKAKGDDNLGKEYLTEAYFLAKKAAKRIQNDANATDLEKASYARSAGWLAFKTGNFSQAVKFAEIGLDLKNRIPEVEIIKLEALLKDSKCKIN